MLKSMTGYGSARAETEDYALTVEVKSVNSKHLDTTIRLASVFSEKEIEVKNLLSEHLQRGKILLSLKYTAKGDAASRVSLNSKLLSSYIDDLQQAARKHGIGEQDILKIAVGMPDALVSETNEENLSAQWEEIRKHILSAVINCDEFRKQEGAVIHTVMQTGIAKIGEGLELVESLDPERVGNVRAKLRKQVEDFTGSERFDPNRFEQELIYYIEKLDISEEKVRLKNHLEYFLKTLNGTDSSGKKLNFVAQEIGREINTIGAKANHIGIQQAVVGMKDELEKIKEQIFNVL